MHQNNNNTISEVTRRAIIDGLSVSQTYWSGTLDEVEFLNRLYNLESMPSTDYRPEYHNAALDIWKHRVMNDDWSDMWVFEDSRFNLRWSEDEIFLRFLCEMLHPVARPDTEEARQLADMLNRHLAVDGWAICEKDEISGRPVYGYRRLSDVANPSVTAAKKTAFTLNAEYMSTQIGRLEKAAESDPELAIGTAKEFIETVCKTILSERGVPYSSDEPVAKLVKLCRQQLHLIPNEADGSTKGVASMNMLLSSLAGIAQGIVELRNLHGTGHGKAANSRTLERRHAKLAVGAATSLGMFLFETHQDHPHKN